MIKHSNSYVKRKIHLRQLSQVSQQSMLNFPPADAPIFPIPPLHSGKFEMEMMREAAAKWVLMHEHPFSIVEEEGFNYMQKLGMSEWKKFTRNTCRADCVKIYEAEKKILKNQLKDVEKISLTTDLWKSKNQKIEYMVIIGHWIDCSWKL